MVKSFDFSKSKLNRLDLLEFIVLNGKGLRDQFAKKLGSEN